MLRQAQHEAILANLRHEAILASLTTAPRLILTAPRLILSLSDTQSALRGAKERRRAGGAKKNASGTRLLGACALALAVGGCASLDPTGLLYDDETPAPEQVSADDGGEAKAFPELSSVPEQPSRSPSRQAERRRMLDQLAADRANAAYSDQPLRGDGNGGNGGREADGAATTGAGEVPSADELPETPPAPSEAETAEKPEARTASPDDSAAASSQPAQADAADQADAMVSPAASRREPPAEETAGRERTTAGDAASGQTSGGSASGQQAATTNGAAGRDAARGSRAARTAAESAQAAANGATAGDGVDRSNIPQIEPSRQGEPIRLPDEAGRTADRGAARGNDAAPSSARATRTQTAQAAPPRVRAPGVERSPGRTPPPANGPGERVAVIYFGHGSTALNGQDRQVLRQVAQVQQRRGGRLRVVGHASHRTATMSPVQHRIVNLDVSMARAEQVADALASFGVSRADIQVEARADSEPVYFEYMPTGEAGNRRTEIYLVP